jgi:enoyl-CoA hydratase/carnithine racemase
MGLVNEVAPHAELDAAVARVCAELALQPSRWRSSCSTRSFERDFEALLELVKLGNMHLTQTSDFKEAVAAWLQQSGPPRRE